MWYQTAALPGNLHDLLLITTAPQLRHTSNGSGFFQKIVGDRKLTKFY
jgi:hypothetical protein